MDTEYSRFVGGPSREGAAAMFDRIAHRYDLANRVLSMRRDVAWRKVMARALPPGKQLRLLDLATGTGDVLLGLSRLTGRVALGVGLDLSGGMLALGWKKIQGAGAEDRLSMVHGDALRLAIASGAMDAVTIAFGIRNVLDVDGALSEMLRVLRPGGRCLILEFSLPANRLLRAGYLLYFRHVLPRIGGLLSGDQAAYRYLNQTVESFPYGQAFCARMETAGFKAVSAKPLTFGIATLYQGDRPQ